MAIVYSRCQKRASKSLIFNILVALPRFSFCARLFMTIESEVGQVKSKDSHQVVLLSDSTYALSVPNRAASNLENNLKVMARYQIQRYLLSGNDCSNPVTVSIDIKKLAEAKGVNWRTLERNISKAVDSLIKTPLSETVSYVNDKGEHIEDSLLVLDRIRKNKTSHVIEVQIGRSYTEYLVNKLLSNPELQTDPHFYLTSSSQYLLPFMQWLTGRIAIERKENPDRYPYEIYAPLDELLRSVPSGTKMLPTLYRQRVIEASINEINTNDYSQLTILNPDPNDFQRKEGRSICGFFFRVALKERTEVNHVPLFINRGGDGLLGLNRIPPWDYLASKLRALGYGGDNEKTALKRIEALRGNAMRVWKALLYTWVQLESLYTKEDKVLNRGGYFQTIYNKGVLPQQIDELARMVCFKAPFYADDTVRAAAEMPNMGPSIPELHCVPEQTEDNNAFLRDYKEKYGHLPGCMAKAAH